MKKFFTLFAAMLLTVAVNATKITIGSDEPSDTHANKLSEAIAHTNPVYDTISLKAGTYTEENDITIDRDIVIMAYNKANKPVVKATGSFSINGASGVKAEFKNVKLNAANATSHVIYAGNALTGNKLYLEGCEVYNHTHQNVIYCSNSKKMDSCVVNDCYFHDNNACIYIVYTGMIGLKVTNSTFVNNNYYKDHYTGMIDAATTSNDVLVDHCTFYNCKAISTDNGSVKARSTKAVVSNCIFALSTSLDGYRAIWAASSSTVQAKNCLTYNYVKDSGGIRSEVTKTDCKLNQDPKFTNAASGNFSYAGDYSANPINVSPARGAGTDGSDLGDPRWYTEPTYVSTNFEDGYDFTAADAAISGKIERNTHYTNPYLRYYDDANPGTATWKIHASRACIVNVSMYMVDNSWNYSDADSQHKAYKNGAHRFVVELLNSKNQPIDSVKEASETEAPGSFPGSFDMPGYLIIPAAGNYTIKLLNPRAHSKCGIEKVTLTYSKDIPTVQSHGSWDYDHDAVFELAADGQSASTTLNLAQSNDNYNFKMIIGSDWRANGHNYNRNYTSASGITENGLDMSIYVNYTGAHKLTWYFKTNKIEVTFPVIPDPIFYVMGDFNSWDVLGNMAEMTEVEGVCTASVELPASTTTKFKILKVDAWGNWTRYGAENAENSMTYESCTNWQLTTTNGGNDINLTTTTATDYLFTFYAGTAKLSVDIPDPSTTAIDNTVVGEKAVKVIRNGQLLIEKDGKTYNVLGTVVK